MGDIAAVAGPVLIPLLIGLVPGLLIGAVILRLSVMIATRIGLSFGRACLVVLVAGIVNVAIGILTGLISTVTGLPQFVNTVISPIAGFFAVSAIYAALIKDPATSRSIGYVKAMLVALLVIVFVILLVICVAAAVFIGSLLFLRG